MPMYYFHACDDVSVADVDGTELADDTAARDHARQVTRELMYRRDGMLDRSWSDWFMSVRDADGVELFSFPFTEIESEKD